MAWAARSKPFVVWCWVKDDAARWGPAGALASLTLHFDLLSAVNLNLDYHDQTRGSVPRAAVSLAEVFHHRTVRRGAERKDDASSRLTKPDSVTQPGKLLIHLELQGLRFWGTGLAFKFQVCLSRHGL